jgi:glycerate 2-kinase
MAERLLEQMRKDALAVFNAGVAAVDPALCISKSCKIKDNSLAIAGHRYDLERFDRIMVIGAGKASAAMGGAMESILPDPIRGRITHGLIITKYGHSVPLKKIKVIEADHPVPDEAGEAAAKKLLEIAETADENTLVINLISGGGSALTPLPAGGITLENKQETTDALLECGAAIHEINTIRKHLSRFKGGQLARAVHPAIMINLVISDVVGDDLSTIASGPAVPDTTTFRECLDIVRKYGLETGLPAPVLNHLNQGAAGKSPETPKPGDPVFCNIHHHIIADNMAALKAAQKKADQLGYNSLVLSSMIEGETREVSKVHTAIAKEVVRSGHPVAPPACILSGGETTVTIQGNGKGGRNQEFALACVSDIAGLENTVILSCGTDGTDGPTDAAGAIADHTTLSRAKALGLDPDRYLSENNAYPFFSQLNDLVKTGPTRTNVMDIRIILIK